jgi:hypothetical protein
MDNGRCTGGLLQRRLSLVSEVLEVYRGLPSSSGWGKLKESRMLWWEMEVGIPFLRRLRYVDLCSCEKHASWLDY